MECWVNQSGPQFSILNSQLSIHPKIAPYQMKRISLRRLHRKMILIDHEIAYIGGINIIDDMHVPNGKAPRIDYAAQLKGPVVHPSVVESAVLLNCLCCHQLCALAQRDLIWCPCEIHIEHGRGLTLLSTSKIQVLTNESSEFLCQAKSRSSILL